MSTLSAETKKMSDLAEITTFESDGSYVYIHDGSGLKRILVSDLQAALSSRVETLETFNAVLVADGAEAHNMIFRGKYLGTEVTDEQWAAIADGTFADLYLGDYWTIDGVNWRIWHFNYWIKAGDTSCTTPHVVIMPDTILYSAQMNSSNTMSGGYVGSEMYTTNLANAKTTINSAFGSDHILSHREYLTNAITSGYPSAGAWYDSTVELPNEIMIYGSHIFKPLNSLGATIPNSYTVCKTQLALAAISSQYVNIRSSYWLRDVVSAAACAIVADRGGAGGDGASNSFGVRPAFGIC